MNDNRFTLTQDGQYGALIYAMQPGEQISQFDDGMLMNNNISGILSYAVESGAQGTSLTINIIRGTRLSLIRNKVLSGQYMISVLISMANVLLAAEQYMLREDRFVFDEDCIFVDVSSCSVSLAYIPTTGYSGMSFAQFVKSFITSGSFRSNEDMGYLMSILNFVNVYPNSSIDEMRAFLSSIQTKGTSPVHAAPQAATSVRSDQSVQPARPAVSAPAQKSAVPPQVTREPAKSVQNAAQPKDNAEKGGLFSKMFGGHKAKSESPAPEPKNNQKSSQPAGIMAGMNIPGMSQPVPAQVSQPSAPVKQQPEKKKFFQRENPAPQAAAPTAPAAVNPGIAEIQTEPVDMSPKTILLNQKYNIKGGEKRAYLIARNGERVAITSSGFTIGKENTSGIVNDYTIKNVSVSRNHAMFEINNGRYYVIDMSSSNGTYVNGSLISSNIGVEVKNGDRITFADEEFKFVIE